MWNLGAKIISVIFHPLLALSYILGFLVFLNPFLLGHFTSEGRMVFLVYFVVNTLVIPVIAILLMKMLGLVNSLQMETGRERIGPMIVVFILYMWMYINFRKEPDIPLILVSILLGTVLSTAIAFVINVVSKISLHMIGMGGILAAVTLVFQHQQKQQITIETVTDTVFQFHIVLVLMILILLTGLVASCRLLLKAHQPKEILQGVILGIATQFLAYWITF